MSTKNRLRWKSYFPFPINSIFCTFTNLVLYCSFSRKFFSFSWKILRKTNEGLHILPVNQLIIRNILYFTKLLFNTSFLVERNYVGICWKVSTEIINLLENVRNLLEKRKTSTYHNDLKYQNSKTR